MRQLLYIITILILLSATGCIKNKQGLCVCRFANRNEVTYNLTDLNRSQGRDSCASLGRAAGQQNGSCVLE